MRLLVTGLHGQVASALRQLSQDDLDVITLGRPELDLAAPGDAGAKLRLHAPDVIVNAAAYTAVDKAEAEPETAFAVNADGAGALAAAAADMGVPFIQISTDYVFDGTAARPLREEDETRPLGVYGASKRAGELAVLRAHPQAVILRTAWVYAADGANFLRTMLRLAGTRDEIRVVDDQLGTPTSAADIAAAIVQVARNIVSAPGDQRLRGIFHLSSAGGPVSWADFAAAIFELARPLGGPQARIIPITTAEYPTPARRPAYSCLDTTRLAQVHGVRLPHWRDSLAVAVKKMHEGQWA